jgi:hypothetical protein
MKGYNKIIDYISQIKNVGNKGSLFSLIEKLKGVNVDKWFLGFLNYTKKDCRHNFEKWY